MGFIYLFFLPVRLPSETRNLPPNLLVRGFHGVWKLPLLRLLSQDGSLSLNLLFLFLSFIFCPTSFRRQWAAFLGAWCPLPEFRRCFVEFAQHSNVLLMNLWGRKWSPCPIPPPPSRSLFIVFRIFLIHSSTDGHLGCYCILAIVNNAAVNLGCTYLFKFVFSFSFR